jgi:hypothetical protein
MIFCMERRDRMETVEEGFKTNREVSEMDRIGVRNFIEMTIGMNIVMTTEMIGSKVTEKEVIKTMKGKVWYRGLKN